MTRYPPEQQQRPHAVADPVGRSFFFFSRKNCRRVVSVTDEIWTKKNFPCFVCWKKGMSTGQLAGAKLSGTNFGRNPLEHTGRGEMPPEFPQRFDHFVPSENNRNDGTFLFLFFQKKKKRRRNSECNNLWNVQLVPVSFRCAAALSTLALTRIMASLHLIALSNKCYSLLLPFKFNWINSVKSRIWGGGDSARPRPSNKVIKAQFFFSETIRFN